MIALFHPKVPWMTINRETIRTNPPFWLRALYFIFIGWWFSLLWINTAWALNASIIGLPLGLWMINRTPQVLTLQATSVVVVTSEEGDVLKVSSVPQAGCLVRILYFVFIGWWFSFFWANVAWFLCAIIIGLPLGLWMLNRLPMVTTLYKP
jgi:uncharacterized membrane protein YccF (DUF307 family)